ncbi:hypothetical protein MTO96_043631 [Rhipicephalus appendiculatus]
MLTVPASKDLVRHYGLTDSLLEQLSYVLVATHKLQRCDDTVYCGGARQFAASAFLRVRLDYDVRFWNKFAYSISAQASVYLAKKIGSGSAGDGTPPEFRTKFSNKSQDILGLADVCHAKRAVTSQDDECTLGHLGRREGFQWCHVAQIGCVHITRPNASTHAAGLRRYNGQHCRGPVRFTTGRSHGGLRHHPLAATGGHGDGGRGNCGNGYRREYLRVSPPLRCLLNRDFA